MNSQDTKIINTSRNNERPDFIRLRCENCGGMLEPVDKNHAACKYCGQRYLIDETGKCPVLDVNINYEGSDEHTKRDVKRVIIVLLAFLVVAVFVVTRIWFFNAPNKASDEHRYEEVAVNESEQLKQKAREASLHLFCKDIFGKEYAEITPQEFASVKYIGFDFDTKENRYELKYSFKTLEDYAGEKEFQWDVQSWSCAGDELPVDFTQFMGLNRVDIYGLENSTIISFPEGARITHVQTDEALRTIGEILPLENIEVLNMKDFMDIHYMDGIEECVNLKDLHVEANLDYTGEALDMSLFSNNTKLEKLWLACGNKTYLNLDAMVQMTSLKEFYLEWTGLEDYPFLDKMTSLERLSIRAADYFDADFLKSLPNLKALHFTNGGYMSAEDIAHLQGVEELTIKVDNEAALEAVAKLPNLKKLDIYTNDDVSEEWSGNVIDISVLAQMPALEELTIEGSWCVGVEKVFAHPTLRKISIGGFEVYPELLQVNESVTEVYFTLGMPKHPKTRNYIGDEVFLKVFPNVTVFQVYRID